ncbi:DUF3168 domain-containing protein [Sphingomonas guangdongensis]|uniref:DUF3168 domain-containing protein n=1 Tax=Sphingomonas guangdongensis TaxID=1141890 RepID=UPI0015C93D49|nr:DUF3168 domain-containing protein [Sphingomonas guangdongensis]
MNETLTTLLLSVSPNVYVAKAPLDYSTPAIVYNHLATAPVDDLNADLDDLEEHAFALIQIDVYDPDLKVASALARTIRRKLRTTVERDFGVTWTECFSDTDETTERTLHRVVMRFRVFALM